MAHNFDEMNLKDPLREITRKDRRMLLASSVVALAVAKVGLVPTNVSALGMVLEPNNQLGFLYVLGLVVAYFLIAFLIYGISDFLAWRVEYSTARLEQVNEAEKLVKQLNNAGELRELLREEQNKKYPADRVIEGLQKKHFSRLELWRRLVVPTVIARALFEFILPIVVSGYALFALRQYACTLSMPT